MDTTTKIQWIMDCARRLAELRPELTPDTADAVACDIWEDCRGSMSAGAAAESYLPAAGPAGA